MRTLSKLGSRVTATLALTALAAGRAQPPASSAPPRGNSFAEISTHAIEFTPVSGNCDFNFEQTIGWQFDVQSEITVTHMGWFDENHDGLEIPHEVAIFDPGGQIIAGTHVVIPTGTLVSLLGDWRSVAIPPTTLPIGQGYIAAGYNGTHSECVYVNVPQRVHPGLVYVDATFAPLNNTFERPTHVSFPFDGFYGVGFEVEGGFATPYCDPGAANSVSAGGAVLASTGGYGTAGATFDLSALPDQPGLLFAGTTTTLFAFGCGSRCVGGGLLRGPVLVPNQHTLQTSFAMSASLAYIQYWYRDPAQLPVCGDAFNLSNALMP